MTRGQWGLTLSALVTLAMSGCVERRFVIETNTPGALVYQNGKPLGATPVDGQFEYYGTYEFTIVKDGFQTQRIQQRIAPPWFAYPPFDFIAENLYPGRIADVRHFQYDLQPLPQPQVQEIIQEAEELRARGQTLPEPSVPSLRKEQPPPAPMVVPAQPIAPAPLVAPPAGGGPILGEPQPPTVIGSSPISGTPINPLPSSSVPQP